MVPVGAISSLSHLEELSMVESKWKWSSNEDRNGRGAGVEDIVRLMHLKKLLVNFVDLSAFSSYVRSGHSRGLNCFLLTVDSVFLYPEEIEGVFYSRECVVNCNSGGDCNSVAFPTSNLTRLWISQLNNLSTIYMEEPTQGDNLANLKRLEIRECPKLKYVLSVGWFQTLQNLEEIIVAYCRAMEEMVVDMGDMGEANNNIPVTLPRLERLELSVLPNLKSICKRTLICSSLEEIDVFNCPMLKMLPFSINSLPSSLILISGSRRWWDSLEWDNANTKMHLQPFFSERPEFCYESEEDQDFSDCPDYGFQVEEDQERQHLQFSERPDFSFQRREEDQERQGTKRKAEHLLMDLNFPPHSLVQQLSPRNWQLWKTHE
ncbi:disease resistance-like protein [Cinnamomum micranthum f. kanehirae]|uniref:Disease resistance-like protein n=1 Tax=Cinnamomum micranthum f. kanehirae TaxID=337451 RepID=A0A3S3NES3_9MAGN|nr:disease resistance-like protein [Cinnamomum micranthum f. kanehirae]